LSAEEFDKHTADAVRSFQRRISGKDTGTLSDQERASLAEAAKPGEAAVGWRLIDDSATGVRLGIPEKLVPRASTARIGSRWTSALGQIQIETFRLHEASLPALFDQEKKTARRYIGYSALTPGSFVITGEQKLKKFVERAQANGNEVRGVTILYDQATEGTMAPVAIAVSDTFEGFPDVTASLPPGHKRDVEYGSALVVSGQGDLLTVDDMASGCRAITVPGFGHADPIAEDTTDNLALLRLYGARNLAPVTIDGTAGAPDAVTLYGIADPLAQAGDASVTSVTAQVSAQGLMPAPKPGFAGALALDSQGRFAGIVALRTPMVAAAGPIAPPVTLVPADAVRGVLQAHGIASIRGGGAADQSVLRVICIRR
jgi:hypothetical protein